MSDLIIGFKENSQWVWRDALTMGVRMGEGFTNTLFADSELKSFVENESRLEHGKRIVFKDPKKSAREIALEFTILGDTKADYNNKRESFMELLCNGKVAFQVPSISTDCFYVYYLGKNVTYARSRSGRFGKMSAKFLEYNPAYRLVTQPTETDNTGINPAAL